MTKKEMLDADYCCKGVWYDGSLVGEGGEVRICMLLLSFCRINGCQNLCDWRKEGDPDHVFLTP